MGEVRWMEAKCINHTEERIPFFFQRGAPRAKAVGDDGVVSRPRSDESVQSLYRALHFEEVRVQEIPRIRVIEYNGSWYTLDNKRLWVLRQYGGEIPVQVVDRPTNCQMAKISKAEREGIASKEPEIVDRESEKRFQGHEFLCKQELLGRVLIWSIRDLLAARSPDEILPIPLRHSKVESYMELHSQWLLEETRAQIQQNLLKISDMACTGIMVDTDVRQINKLKNGLRRINCRIEKDISRSSKQTKTYRPAASDIVLLATFSPQSPGELLTQTGACCTLGVVQGGQMSGSSFEVIIYATTHGPVYKEIVREDQIWYAVRLESIVTCQRIWDSLHQPANTPLAEYIATYQEPPQFIESAKTPALDAVEQSKLQVYFNKVRRLNLSQAEAVQSFIARQLNREQGFSVELIQGPPGTGKTSTLTAMLSPMVCTSTRILVCAPTNTAVNEAARRFLVQKQQDVEDSQTAHFCRDSVHASSSDGQSRCCTPLRLGDIVMLGSEARLAVEGSALEAIFLPVRVKRLLAALHPESGWEALCQTFLMQLQDVKESTLDVPVDKRILDRRVLKNFGLKIIAHGEVLCNDLPTPHLSIRRMKLIKVASCSIRKLFGLLAIEGRSEGDGEVWESTFEPEENMETNFLINDDGDTPQFSPNAHKEQGTKVESSALYSEEFSKESQNLLELLTAKSETPIFPELAARSFEWVEAECLESASLVFSTVSSAALRIMKLGVPFSCVIIDEAAQLVEAESTIVLQMKDVKQLVLVGDQKQLPATVMSQLAQKHGYARSLFERLQSLGHPCRLLEVQYRMHPAISAFPNKQFYNRKLKNGDNVLKENYGQLAYQKDTFGSYAFIDIGDGTEVNAGPSKKNVLEAELVLHLIRRVHDSVCAEFKEARSFSQPITVGVISPYSGQVSFIKDQMCRSDSIYGAEAAGANVLDVEVRSIDGFQGKETDIIIFSAVRANQSGRIGFVDDERRTNVALTRGRHAVWILGSASTLCAHSRLWRNLVDDARQVSCFFDATRVEWMNDLINIFRKRNKPVLQQRDERASKFSSHQLLSMSVSPRRSGWESEEPPMNFGPDWSFDSSLEPTVKEVGVLTKRARNGQYRRAHHYDPRRQEPAYFGDRPRASHQRRSDTEYHRRAYREYNDTRFDGGISLAPCQVNYDTQVFHHGLGRRPSSSWNLDPSSSPREADRDPSSDPWDRSSRPREADWDHSSNPRQGGWDFP